MLDIPDFFRNVQSPAMNSFLMLEGKQSCIIFNEENLKYYITNIIPDNQNAANSTSSRWMKTSKNDKSMEGKWPFAKFEIFRVCRKAYTV